MNIQNIATALLLELQQNVADNNGLINYEAFESKILLSLNKLASTIEKREIFKKAYDSYWTLVKDVVDEDGWAYNKELPHNIDGYFESNTGKKIEYQKHYEGKWRGCRWRPVELSSSKEPEPENKTFRCLDEEHGGSRCLTRCKECQRAFLWF